MKLYHSVGHLISIAFVCGSLNVSAISDHEHDSRLGRFDNFPQDQDIRPIEIREKLKNALDTRSKGIFPNTGGFHDQDNLQNVLSRLISVGKRKNKKPCDTESPNTATARTPSPTPRSKTQAKNNEPSSSTNTGHESSQEKEDGYQCLDNSDCISKNCVKIGSQSRCKSKETSGQQPTSPTNQNPSPTIRSVPTPTSSNEKSDGQACTKSSDCSSNNCVDQKCTQKDNHQKEHGEQCTSDTECKSKSCVEMGRVKRCGNTSSNNAPSPNRQQSHPTRQPIRSPSSSHSHPYPSPSRQQSNPTRQPIRSPSSSHSYPYPSPSNLAII